jgi:hypothetical protein
MLTGDGAIVNVLNALIYDWGQEPLGVTAKLRENTCMPTMFDGNSPPPG